MTRFSENPFLRLVFLLPIFLALFTAKAGNWGGIETSAFFIQENDPTRFKNGLMERMGNAFGRQAGLHRSFPVTRYTSLRLGISFSLLDFQLETQGVFPETNQYGFVYANGKSQYWGIPIAFHHSFARQGRYRLALSLRYEPSVETYTTTRLIALGGAEQSAYFSGYKNDIQRYHHDLRIAFVSHLTICKNAILEIAPWMSMGNAYYRSPGKGPGSMSYGMNVNFCFKLPAITIEWVKDPQHSEKKKQLEKKQKEIEEQLKNKPTPK